MQTLAQGFTVDDKGDLSVNLSNPFGMNKQPSTQAIAKFRFEAKRCRGWDKEFMILVDNSLLESIDPTTLRRMKDAIYQNRDLEWVISQLENARKTFIK